MTGSCCGICSFFFQAEDGIRDIGVTGVQTCALPISRSASRPPDEPRDRGCAAPLSNAREADALVLERAAEILFTCSHKPQSIMLGALCKVLRGTAAQLRDQP